MSYLSYSYPNKFSPIEPKKKVIYKDENGQDYKVSITPKDTSIYKVTLKIARKAEELENIKKKEKEKLGENNIFYGSVRVVLNRKAFQTEKDGTLSIHDSNNENNIFIPNKKNTTNISPAGKPFDVLKFLLANEQLNISNQTVFIADEIFIDGYRVEDGELNYKGAYLSMNYLGAVLDKV